MTSHAVVNDLVGLLALPARWAGRDAESVIDLTLDAIERIIDLEVSYVDVPTPSPSKGCRRLRLSGVQASDAEQFRWAGLIAEFNLLPIGLAPTLIRTARGDLYVVRLSLGDSAAGGSAWFGSLQAHFPRVGQSSLLQVAVTLAATGLQSARIDHERERASRAKDEFLAMLGHELRNPLAPMFNALELIRRQADGVLDRPHAIIERQARQLSRLVDDLLDVSRITRGQIELKRSEVELRGILLEALEAVAPLIAQRRQSITSALPPESAHVFGDAGRLRQVFSNLLTNASKFTPQGGHIVVESAIDRLAATVRVRDDGEGMSAELMPRLFEIFEQGARTIDRSSGGLGIGLAIARRFVQLHGGSILAESAGPGQGATFTVLLPMMDDSTNLVAPAALASPAPARPSIPPPLALRVMLVDDNVDALETMADFLRLCSFDVSTAIGPNEALAAVAAFRPQVAVFDIGLPGLDGYQLAQEFRRRHPDMPIRFIALTGYGQAEDHQRSLEQGFERHLVKPTDIVELVKILNKRSEPEGAPALQPVV